MQIYFATKTFETHLLYMCNIILISRPDSFPIDPYCDPANPKPIQFSEISAAAYNIRDGIEHTPCTVRQHARFVSSPIK